MIGTSTITSSPDTPVEDQRLSLNERLALIELMSGGGLRTSSESPLVADLFSDLWELVDATVSGAKVDRMTGKGPHNGFKVIEINAETGENLGRLNMLYLNKPIACYYLVYVEVAAPFRNRGLGNVILKAFRDFLVEKSAVGILDNIIPEDDPTYDIYVKLDWKPVDWVNGVGSTDSAGQYMVYIPPAVATRDPRDSIRKLVHHIKRKRAAIDMRDNELMVQRTIEEFKELYSALVNYFGERVLNGESDSLVRFMFTRYVTKLLGFRRKISQLLGYTGGESLGQLAVHPEIRELPAQSYAPRGLADNPSFVDGDKELWLHLPEDFKQHPARTIDSLPNYRRPALMAWLQEQGRSSSDTFTIGDLLDLGFDPTRLKEITLEGQDYIFERLHARLIPRLLDKKNLLESVACKTSVTKVRNATLRVNPPLLVIRDRGNAYVLRRKVQGIHWEEAVDQLQSVPALRGLNSSMRIDKLIKATVKACSEWLGKHADIEDDALMESMTYFVSWDLETNQPNLMVDMAGSSVATVWIA